MKSLALMFVGLAASVTMALAEERVEQQRQWSESYPVADNAPGLEIRNIWGDVRVTPGPSGVITIKARELRSAPNQELFERSQDILPLLIEADEQRVSLYIGQSDDRWYRRDPCRGCRLEVQFEVQVPPGTQVDVSTVNDGTVEVRGIRGLIKAANVNGPVSVFDAHSCEHVESINGKVRLSFARAPRQNCQIDTINGDIWLQLPDGAGLDAAVVLSHGRLMSELPVTSLAMPAKVEHEENAGRHRYQITQPAGLRIAGGGPEFTFSSLNGDVHIQNKP